MSKPANLHPEFCDLQITFTKRYLNSDAYTKAKSIGKPVYTEFGTKAYSDPTKSFFGKMLNNVVSFLLTLVPLLLHPKSSE